MSRKRYEISTEGDAEVDMTSMIDIVFLLIIFFMCVTELTKLDVVAGIQLPIADQAVVDMKPDPDRTVINLNDVDGGGVKLYYKNLRVDREQLRRRLHVDAMRRWNTETNKSDTEVIIRADQKLHFRHVQDTMLDCVAERLWKISLVAKQKRPGR